MFQLFNNKIKFEIIQWVETTLIIKCKINSWLVINNNNIILMNPIDKKCIV